MRYLMLIYYDEVANDQMSQQEQEASYAAHVAFGEEAQKRNAMRDGKALLPTTSAKTVRVRTGKPLVTDGPFAETKEQLGGFYLLDCKDLDEALEMAALLPEAKHGSIEVRPILEFE